MSHLSRSQELLPRRVVTRRHVVATVTRATPEVGKLEKTRARNRSSGPVVLCALYQEPRADRGLVGKHVPAELDEEGVIVTLVRVLAVVMHLRGSVGDILFRVDRSDRTHVGLIARGT